MVTLRGVEAAVLVPVGQWRSLRERARPGLKALLLARQPLAELALVPRGQLRRRARKSTR
jgi:PHD/YefM family antitoxin component YafN of YafNO toxin-antitoxin module